MASQHSGEAFTTEETNAMRLRIMIETVSKKILHDIFRKGTSKRPRGMRLMDFYKTINVNVKKFSDSLHTEQLQKINTDPAGDSFDVTLLFMCIRWGNERVNHNDTDKWKEGKANLESRVTTVKKYRNILAHNDQACDSPKFVTETEKLRALLSETIKAAGSRYGIPPKAVVQEINEMNDAINSLRDKHFSPQDLREYKKQVIFPLQSELVKKEGKKEVKNQYTKRCNTDIDTVNHVIDISFQVNDIFTEMELYRESSPQQKRTVAFKYILEDESQSETNKVVLIEGWAGAGKTTLIKKILCDWVLGSSTMKYLNSYDLILHVECRNSSISSFKEILGHLMPEFARGFKGDDLKTVTLAQKIMIILDGLDELNRSSALLFDEVLYLKRDFGITVMVTTRPEKIPYFNKRVQSLHLEVKHIRILGVFLERIDELVIRYHRQIAKIELDKKGLYKVQPIDGLLEYLKRTQDHLRDLWRLPYNLVLVTILWTLKYMDVRSITTAPELYWEIHKLYLSKLMERLESCETTKYLQTSQKERIISFFMYALSRESLVGLKNNHINLPREAIQRLCITCYHLEVPFEEMISAVLKKIPTYSLDKIYCYHHKGLQDFLAALFIWMQLMEEHKCDLQKTTKDVYSALSQNSIPVCSSQEIIRFTSEELKSKSVHITNKLQDFDVEKVLLDLQSILSAHNIQNDLRQCIATFAKDKLHAYSKATTTSAVRQSSTIRDILQKLHGTVNFDISKYQNTIISLIGMFYMERNSIDKAIKMEALTLLQETGVRDQDAWINVLNSVKCDSDVAFFISQQSEILDGTVKISDSSIYAYVSLLQEYNRPIVDFRKASIEIVIKAETSQVNVLLGLINKCNFDIHRIELHQDFQHPYASTLMEDTINHAFDRCDVRIYKGVVTAQMRLPANISELFVSVASNEGYVNLRNFLRSKASLTVLDVCMVHYLDPGVMEPLPSVQFLNLWLLDITTEDDAIRASQIIKQLKPSTDSVKIRYIMLPRCTLTVPSIQRLLQAMEGVEICSYFCLPTACRPVTKEEEEEIQEAAEKKCGTEIHWGEFNIDEW